MDISTSEGAPDGDNRWFCQQFKDNDARYGWQVAWSFNGDVYKRYKRSDSAFTPWLAYALKSDFANALIHRGYFTDDMNKLDIPIGTYSLGSGDSFSNGPTGISYCVFIQFYSTTTQMIVDAYGIYVRKYVGNPAAWTSWHKISTTKL